VWAFGPEEAAGNAYEKRVRGVKTERFGNRAGSLAHNGEEGGTKAARQKTARGEKTALAGECFARGRNVRIKASRRGRGPEAHFSPALKSVYTTHSLEGGGGTSVGQEPVHPVANLIR